MLPSGVVSRSLQLRAESKAKILCILGHVSDHNSSLIPRPPTRAGNETSTIGHVTRKRSVV